MAFGVTVVFVLLSTVAAIYEDQVGKFDWRQQYIGCPRQIHFERSKGGKSQLIFMSTESNVITALKSTSGEIAWRQLHEEDSATPPSFVMRNKMLISLSRDGEVVRCWERDSGALSWETHIDPSQLGPGMAIFANEGTLFVLRRLALTAITLSSGQVKWTASLERNREWLGVVSGSQSVSVVGGTNSSNVLVLRLDASTGVVLKQLAIPADWFDPRRCLVSNGALTCFESSAVNVFDLSSDPVGTYRISVDGVVGLLPLTVDGLIAVRTAAGVSVYRLSPTHPPEIAAVLEKAEVVAAFHTSDGRDLLAAVGSGHQLSVTELPAGRRVFEGTLKGGAERAPVAQLGFASAGREFEFVAVGEDCLVEFLVASGASSVVTEWTRHEALSQISAAEMVDLPLSEAQAGIESEFSTDAGNLLESLGRRLWSQADQLRRTFIAAVNEIFSASSSLSIRTRSFTDWMALLRSSAAHRDSARSGDAPLERDYFNMRKMIVVSTRKPVVYGLDSSDGSVAWRLYLGRSTEPLVSSLGAVSVPLFIQRTTAHYQFASRAAVVLTNSITGNGLLFSFNPITGALVERADLGAPIKRAELLPSIDANSLHPIMFVDRSNKVTLYPAQFAATSSVSPMYLFSFDASGLLEGFSVDLDHSRLTSLWKSNFALTPEQKIVAVSGKPTAQRVHSPGRVLGDRSVLYKYSNPNLVAVAVLDSAHSRLQISFVDAVNGYVVYSAKQSKVSGPVRLVQCENWLTYSYWSEKGRRTEIGVIELYEGSEQTDEDRFNSLTPSLPSVVHAISQAYIFPQGVSALGVTETEQGLSTRSLLIAMPFGGLYGISKRMIDSRRPLEMTAELAEEMLIPYRPELPIASEDFINYNQTVHNIRAFKTAPSGLESTSLILAYGLDLFFVRVTPSGTFDILKDDFDHLLITLVLAALVLGSVIFKKLGKNHSLRQAWQ